MVFAGYFSEVEINHIIDFTQTNLDLFRLVWFNPIDVSQKVPVWRNDASDTQSETEKRGHYAEVFNSSLGELRMRMLGHQLTNVTLKLRDYVKVENLKLAFTKTDTNIIFQDGNMEFVKNNVNKGLATGYVMRHLGVGSDDVLVAGNAINDVEMLDTPTGTTVLVGGSDTREVIMSYLSNSSQIVGVETPEGLGSYLSSL